MTAHCDFCGFDFDPTCASNRGCSSCPLVKNCGKIVCPRCGYEMLPEAKLVGWMRKIFQKGPAEAKAAAPERR
jgi:uncharacterized Zn finger protein (UPF0148 family)